MTPTSIETWSKERYQPRELPELMADLKAKKRTGQLVLHFTQGRMAACEWQQTAPGGNRTEGKTA